MTTAMSDTTGMIWTKRTLELTAAMTAMMKMMMMMMMTMTRRGESRADKWSANGWNGRRKVLPIWWNSRGSCELNG